MKHHLKLISTLSIIAFAGSTAQIAAHGSEPAPQFTPPETCLEPFKPAVAFFVETGTEDELRQEFELYFREVDAYLNCLNAESSRVHQEAQQAANEYRRVLDRVPPPPYKAQPESEAIPSQPMVTSGELNLDYRGSGG